MKEKVKDINDAKKGAINKIKTKAVAVIKGINEKIKKVKPDDDLNINSVSNFEKIDEKIKSFNPKIALILGSGFEKLLVLEKKFTVSYEEYGLKYKNVEGHKREFVFGYFNKIPVMLASRVHYYESGDTKQIIEFYKTLYNIGIRTVLATTAVGGINKKFKAGDIMLIKSHINMSGTNPLIGLQPIRFLDLSDAYDKKLRFIVKDIAKQKKIKIWEGVHMQVSGPTYETPAEIVAFRNLGADTISMSTVLDCICANYFGIKFIAFAGITNKATTEDSKPLTHKEVVETGTLISEKLKIIVKEFLSSVYNNKL
ncbi:MAG: purine-nucleoside phosphorylase [Clostridia bacterium]|nr:purine-nucleoside phosphorylase [Clostridia bacterium]